MSELKLSETIRYLAAGMVVFIVAYTCFPGKISTLLTAFGTIGGPLLVFVVGSISFVIYRSIIYNLILFLVLDKLNRSNVRNQFLAKYNINGRYEAEIVWKVTSKEILSRDSSILDLPSSEVHLLYITFITSTVGAIYHWFLGDDTSLTALKIGMPVVAILSFIAALNHDYRVEKLEALTLKGANWKEISEYLKRIGYEPKPDETQQIAPADSADDPPQETMSDHRDSSQLAFETLPFYETGSRLWRFIMDPEIRGENLRDSTLVYAGRDFLDSIFIVVAFLAVVESLTSQFYPAKAVEMIDPVYLVLMLSIQAFVFGMICASLVSIILLARARQFHWLIFHHTLRTHAVLVFLVALIFWLLLQRVIVVQGMAKPINSFDLWFGGILGVLVVYLTWRLFGKPLYRYFLRYFGFYSSAPLALLVFVVALCVNAFIRLDFEQHMIDKPSWCNQLFMRSLEGEKSSGSESYTEFMTNCLRTEP